MRAFFDLGQMAHQPRFFLQRGHVRANFEVPARAEALLAGLADAGVTPEAPGRIDPAALHTVHDPAYVDFLAGAWAAWSALPDHGPELVPNIHPAPEMLALGSRPGTTVQTRLGFYTADTSCPIGPHTWDASLLAAAAALAAAAEAAAGRNAYALARPPGHHAYRARAGGHCYVNNAALAAQHMCDRGASRVAVLDIDSHHGNGTQAAFYERKDVLFVSIHGDPRGYYPWYVGFADETGTGPGEGLNRNLPLPAGTGDAGWLAALGTAMADIGSFGPDALVLSLGMDASEHEPLRFLSVSDDAFARAADAIAALRRPTVLVQEGGYDPATLRRVLPRMLGPFG